VALAGARPAPRFWLAAIVGAALVTGFALREGAGRLSPGDLLLAGAVVSAALGYALSGQLTRDLKSGWEVISWALILALPVSAPLALVLAPAEPSSVSLASWIGLGYVAVLSQYVGFFAWNAGLAVGGIARVSQVQLLQTFVTLVLAATLNGERVDAVTWLVAALVVALVLIGRKAVIRRPP
jgi:drug/metabolite transporter (DMT)-like permease